MLSDNPSKYRYFIELSYDGASFHGWQIQPNANTVQETLNKAFSLMLKKEVNLVGCGRTDTGVHATHYIAHTDLEDQINEPSQLIYRLNRYLENSIAIQRIVEVSQDHHARFSAISRTYFYMIARSKQPFMQSYSWFYDRQLDIAAMQQAADLLKGVHDFTSFARLHADTTNHICNIQEIEWILDDEFLYLRVKANRLLRNMVRAMVGTLLEIGAGNSDPGDVIRILDSADRGEAGASVPAHGLFLAHVQYPDEIIKTRARPPLWLLKPE